ncbi:MAG: hypothetical protein FD166_1590 [Bacteroidetes bacterium]|nr:MAG: hypothetical protein FD166_1590 [Bacteroidota bacterium]
MPENGSNGRNFLRRLGERIFFILTGEKPRRQHRHRTNVNPGLSGLSERQQVVPAGSKSRHRRKKKVLPKFLENIINPEREKSGRSVRGKVILTQTSDTTQPDIDRSPDFVGSNAGSNNPERIIKPIKIRKHRPYKKKSFLKRLFETSRQDKKEKKSQLDFWDDLKKVMPEEGYAMFNSLGFYILAYLLVYLIYQFTETLVASNFDIDSVLFYYEIYFPIGNASPLWSRFNIIVITLSSPFVSVMTSLILLRVVLMREKLKPQLRLFLLWVAFHGATHFLGAFVAGIATSQGFGYVANWLYMNVFFRILVSLIFLFLLTVTGYYSAVFALETLPAGVRQHRWRLTVALGARFIIPWIIGGLMIIVVKYPNAIPQHPNIMVYDAIIIASMGFMVIPAFFNFKAKPRSVAERPSRHKRPPGLLISTLAIVTLILFRLAFDRGIHFVINFSFDMGYYR